MRKSEYKKIVFLLPAFNEEEGIANTIRKIPVEILNQRGYLCEIVIIDGRSTDKTVSIARTEGVRVILSPKRGYGFQYKYGISRVTGDYVITGDSDGTYPFDIAPHLIRLLEEEGLDFITTNRFYHLDKNSMSFFHYFGNKVLTYLTDFMFSIKLQDSQSGMWCFRLDKVKKIHLEDNDMAFSEELKIKSFRKLKCKEIGIVYKKRYGRSKLNYKHAFKNILFLFRLWLKNEKVYTQ